MSAPRHQHPGLARVLRGPFGLLWAGQTISLLGDAVFLAAFTWQLAVQWQQPALLGLLLAARVLAEVATLGVGGFIIDRLSRRTIILAADASRGLLLFALAATLHRPPSTLVLALLLVAYGVLTALFPPALTAYIPEIVQRDRLAAANALYYISLQAAMVAGPAAGAVLVGLGAAPAALRVNGLSFLLAAAATVQLPARPPASDGEQGLARVADGFRAARRVGWVGGTILLISITNLGIIGAERLALPGAAADRYSQLGGYGIIVVAIAAGGVLAAWATGRSPWPREPGVATYRAALLLGAATLGFGLARGIAAAGLLGPAFGASQQRAHLLWVTSLQRNVPDRLLGRVTAVAEFGSFVFLPVSLAVGGLVVEGPARRWSCWPPAPPACSRRPSAWPCPPCTAGGRSTTTPPRGRIRVRRRCRGARSHDDAPRRIQPAGPCRGGVAILIIRSAPRGAPPGRPVAGRAGRAARRAAVLGQPVGAGRHHALGRPPAGARRRAGVLAARFLRRRRWRCRRRSWPASGRRLIEDGRVRMPDLGGAIWRKSTYSAVNGCVEVAFVDGLVAVRDAKDRQGQAMMFTLVEWRAFLDGVRDGQFDLPCGSADKQETSTWPA